MIQVEINDAEVRDTIRRLRQATRDLRPALRDIGEYLLRATKQRFAAGVAPDGTRWAANTEATLEATLRRKAGATVRRLGERAGRGNRGGAALLRGKRPLIGESKRLSREIAVRVTADTVAVSSGLEYSAVHQYGAKRGSFGRTRRGAPIPWGDIPARRFLGASAHDLDQVVAIVREHLRKAAG